MMGLFDIFKKKDNVVPPVSGPAVAPITFEGYESCGFELLVEDVFTISGRGTVVTGRISKGSISVGESVTISNGIRTVVTGIEAFRAKMNYAQEGDNVGLLLQGISRDQVKRGDVLYK